MKQLWLVVALVAVVAGCNTEKTGTPTTSVAATAATAQTSAPEWVVVKHTLTTNSYCFTPDKARVRESNSQLSLVETTYRPKVYWTVPKAADGSVKNAEVVEDRVTTFKNRWRVNVPAGSGPRVISLVSLSFACRAEYRP
jgi:hypothetical protein